jgi:hypothetical protein
MIPHHHFSSESGAIQMRFQRLLFAAVVACGVAACTKDDAGVTHAPPPLAYVRYINAVPDTFDMDFRAVDQVTYSPPFLDTKFRGLGVGNYQGYQAGSRHIRLFLDPSPANNLTPVDPVVVSTVMVDTTFSFTAGTYYTIVHVGHARAPSTEKLMIITDALPAQSANVQYRVINAASVQGAVDVYVTTDSTGTVALAGAPTLAAVAPLVPSAYQTRAPGTLFNIRLTTPGTTTIVGPVKGATLQGGTAGTTLADPIFGSGQAGSVLTAFIFDASSAGTVGASFATPGVLYFPDLQPARTTSP